MTAQDKQHGGNAREKPRGIFRMLRSMKCISGFAKAEFLCNVVGERFM
ncbi:hypothetical protein V2S85_23285 [Novosphingobium resinovorum]|nr:hypothetical protein [Novosphingobium resinovorum]